MKKLLQERLLILDKIVKKNILKNPVEEVGNWKSFVGIVEKYGLVPMTSMPTTVEGESATRVTNLFSETVRSNAVTLLKLKEQNKNLEELRQTKSRMLAENYEFLSKVYGEPVNKFNYHYIDKNGNNIILKDMTPKKFVKQYLSIDVENFVLISNVPKKNRKYGQKLKNSSAININKMKYVEFLHISIEELKELAIKQLKDNIPVMVGIDIKKFADKESGVLDTRLYHYDELVKYKKLNKQDAMLLGDIELHHWMTITGVQIEEGIPKRWKVEDSYGDKEKVNGYYIMNDNYFEKYVFTIIINKKYLSEKQIELYNQKAIAEEN